MSEVNEHWRRSRAELRRCTLYGAAWSVVLWPISYYTSFVASQIGQGMWFATVSTIALIAAIVTTIGTALGVGVMIIERPPLSGANR